MKIFEEILANWVFSATFFAWILSCLIKGMWEWAKNKRLDWRRFMGPGGMPSSHSTLAMALATSTGRAAGFGSPLFALCCAFALVVMYDASGIRRSAGQQARMINRIVEAWNHNDAIDKEIKLKELLGHTPFEVLAGAALGTVVGLLFPGI